MGRWLHQQPGGDLPFGGQSFGGLCRNSSGRPNRPGHCNTQSACQSLPAGGGIIDNESACFFAWGPAQYWREENQGFDGQLLWTNVFSSDVASNWAWWQLDFEESGSYELEYHATVEFAVHQDGRHLIVADGQEIELTVDQSLGNGWTSLGVYDFAEGGVSLLHLRQQHGQCTLNQHIVADATASSGWRVVW